MIKYECGYCYKIHSEGHHHDSYGNHKYIQTLAKSVSRIKPPVSTSY